MTTARAATLLLLAASLFSLAGCRANTASTAPGPDAALAAPDAPRRPWVVAHRGASGHLPEHSLEAYALAFGMGADIIEPDVLLTSDGVAICAHDLYAEGVTDAAAKFPARADARGRIPWAALTLAEVKTLSLTGRPGAASATPISGMQVATFDEMLDLITRLNQTTGRTPPAMVIPEPKDPAFHRARGLDVERAVVDTLARRGLRGRNDPAIIQCFDLEALRRIRRDLKCDVRLFWLMGETPTDAQLDDAATFADGLGPSRKLIEPDLGSPATTTNLVARAHALRLLVVPYTFKNEPEAIRRFFTTHGVDGVFADYPDVAIRARGE